MKQKVGRGLLKTDIIQNQDTWSVFLSALFTLTKINYNDSLPTAEQVELFIRRGSEKGKEKRRRQENVPLEALVHFLAVLLQDM